MKHKPILILLALVALTSFIANAASTHAQTGGTYELTWSTLDGGGGASTGGTYSLDGTIGQPDAGQMNGGTFSLTGGFWDALVNVTQSGKVYLPFIRK